MEEAKSVARAILAAFDWTSTPDSRKAAVSYLDSIKAGDVRVLATTSFILVKKDWSSEIRLQAFKLLQHLVRLRWEELSPTERRDFANVAIGLMSEIADPCEGWALKSQTAALVAEIVRREGLVLWQELFPSLVTLSSQGPIQAELVSMMLRWLPEDITVHNEDLEGERRRLLLRGLTQSLPDILPLLYTILERHFGAALSEAAREQFEPAKQHAATVIATLNAVTAYAEWAPLPDLATYGIIHGCGILLSYPDFRLHACEFFKLVSSRKRPSDAAAEFDSAVSNVLQILMSVSSKFLEGSSTNQGSIEESEVEFGEYVCESMVSLGSSNLQCIARDSTILTPYLQQMLRFFQHCKFALHFQSLQFWLALMREAMSKPKVQPSSSESSTMSNPASGHGQADSEKKRLLSFINDDMCTAILEMSFQRLLKKEKANPETLVSLGALELWSDDFEGKGEFSQYRYKLLELIRFIASHKPVIAGVRVSERIVSVIKSPSLPMPTQDLGMMESLTFALENIVNATFDGMDEFGYRNSDEQLALCSIFEGLLHQFLTLKWTEPSLVEILGHYLDAFGPFLKYFPNAVGSVVTKLFELLTSLPFSLKDPSMNNARHARFHICTSFIRIAKAADQSILPHMKGIADTMANLQSEGRILRGEQNILGEALFVMASAAGIQQQQEVLAWLLEPLSHQWTQLEWQNNYLSEPSGLVQLCAETSVMWSVFHTVTFFEKALKRSGFRKGNVNLQSDPVGNSVPLHPMASHLSWMLPPLLKLLRSIHSLWSAPVYQMLPAEMKAAMTMSDFERSSLLGEGPSKSAKGSLTFMDGSQAELGREGQVETKENDVRNWLKGIRDSGYNVLGLSATIGDSFFNSLDIHSLALALMENLPSMEFRHIRQLVHSVVIPLIKYCPTGLWEVWLEKLLHPLFVHSQQVLSSSWSALLHEGRAKVPDSVYVLASSDLKVEVMEEKLLRDLTREVCQLLSVIASPALNSGLPSLEPCSNRMDSSSLKELDTYAESSLSSFLLKHKGLALPALQMCIEAFTWTDSEAVAKVSSFCTTVVLVSILTTNMELQDFVCRDLFSAVIRGLTLESNTIISAELIGLCREIYVYLCDRNPAPRQVLLSLPCIKPGDLLAFEEALTKTASPKEQKQHLKSLLMMATGNQLKALAVQRSVNVITNMSARPRGSIGAPDSRVEEGDSLGLAAIL